MFKFAFIILRKDLHLALGRGYSLAQALLLGLLLIFVFSLSKAAGELASPHEAAAIFWLSSVFCQVLIFNNLYSIEEANSCRECLILSPLPLQGIWLGKAAAGLILLAIAQIVFLPASIIFLGQNISWPLPGLASLGLTDVGICALGSLLGAASQGQSGKESLLSIILFPLLIPLLLAAVSLGGAALSPETFETPRNPIGLAAAFDAVFVAAGLALFGFLYRGGE